MRSEGIKERDKCTEDLYSLTAVRNQEVTGRTIQGVGILIRDRINPGGETGENGEIIRVRLPNKRNREMFGYAELMMGANHIRVKCVDGTTRLGRIKGKIKKKVWIREGDILIVIPWSFQDDKADIVYRYTSPQVDWLKKSGYL